MNKIVIDKFGPLNNVELSINDINVYIGPQASGKSTLSKLIYFFLSVKDDFTQYYVQYITANRPLKNNDVICGDLSKKLRYKFVQLFGTTKHLDKETFRISYYYSQNNYISLQLGDDGYVKVMFSMGIKSDIKSINHLVTSYLKKSNVTNFASQNDILIQSANQRAVIINLSSQINRIFNNDNTVIYIPACRSILATLSDYIYNLINDKIIDLDADAAMSTTSYSIDYSTKTFIDRITHLKKMFVQGIDDLIKDKRKFADSSISVNNELLSKVKDLSYSILKGEYKYSYNEERLYYTPTEYVKFSLSSSGQQEATWIILLIFAQILNNAQTTLLIEEPEAHLHPEAQMSMVHLISLFANIKGNSVIVTTHSPYILTSINSLMYAYNVGKKQGNKSLVEQIVDKSKWIDPKQIGAYQFANGTLEYIIDESMHQIKAELIDSISETINNIYYQLLEMDN